MDPNSIQIAIAKFQQLGAVSALLGGLAFAAALSLLATVATPGQKNMLSRPSAITIVFAIACAASQIVATIGWTFLALYIGSERMPEGLQTMLSRWSSLIFILGVLLLFVSIGVSGWISSRVLGIITTVIGSLGGFFALYIIFQFFN